MKESIRVRLCAADRLSEFVELWDGLNDAHYHSPVLSCLLFQIGLREFGTGQELLMICEQNEDVVAMGILQRTGWGRWQTFQPSQSPLGAWIQRPEIAQDVLLESVLRALPGLALTVGITQQDPDLMPRPVDARRLGTLDYIQTARVQVIDSFDEYWQRRGVNLKQNMRTQRNRLARESVTTRLEVISDPGSVAAAVDAYGEMESRGWKGSEGTAVHPSNAQGRFYRSLLFELAQRGQAAAYRYFFNDVVAAIDLCIFKDGTLVLLKTTYDESIKGLSPTMLMRQDLLQLLFSDRMWHRFEFYGRVMQWSRRLTEDIRTMYHLTFYRWPLLKTLTEARRRRRSAQTPTAAEQVVAASNGAGDA